MEGNEGKSSGTTNRIVKATDEELEAFRTQWRSELESSRAAAGFANDALMRREVSPTTVPASQPATSMTKAALLKRPPPPTTHSRAKESEASKDVEASNESAVALYEAAVTAEREGRLNDALRMYRTAFRKDENVDKVYHRHQTRELQRQKEADAVDPDDVTTVDDLVFSYTRSMQVEPDYVAQHAHKPKSYTKSIVASLLASFNATPWDPDTREHITTQPEQQEMHIEVTFQPKDTIRPIHITRLPDEILLYILSFVSAPSQHAQYPDIRSLERGFSLVSRKARLLTLQNMGLWKDACTAVYRPPLQLERQLVSAASVVAKMYANDWRLMWIEQPRVRTDGVYISQITYVRRGMQDGSSYYDPTHLVTYYRYLCFLPSGDVVSLLSHDIPATVVPNLLSTGHSGKSQAGYTVGRWRVINRKDEGTIVQLSSLEDPRKEPSEVKYSLKMICRLKSTKRGRMNKLELLSLLARNVRTDEEDPISIQQANNATPCFYFSRVRSYD